MFANSKVPAVGGCIGVERLFIILEEKIKKDRDLRQNETEVLVGTIGNGK